MRLAVMATWVVACLGVVLAVTSRQLAVAIWALLAAGNAAGWMIATWRWQEWQQRAEGLRRELARRDGGPS